ncbi:DNA polymerase [Ceratobasidium sp. AG-Ba]|nr:DNA polymerase [Ceratobasidium sp. AG-Ba]
MESDEEIVAVEPRGRPIVKAQSGKRQRDESSPLNEGSRIVIERSAKHRRATPYASSTRASTPVGSTRAPSEADVRSESGHVSETSLAPTIARRTKTKLKRQEMPPEEELAAMIRRIASSKSTAYEGFSDPIIDWGSGTPPTRHIWTCLTCDKTVTREVGVADTSAFRSHKDRYCRKPTNNDTLLGDHGFRGSGENMTERDVRESCALWVARCSRPMSIINDQHLEDLLHPSVRRYKPHRTTITADIKLMYHAIQDKIKADLAGVQGTLHLALDLFTSDNGHDYLGIVAFHQEVVHSTMKIKRFDGDAHTGVNLAKKLRKVAIKFGIENRFWGLVGDAASNHETMLDRLVKFKLERHKGRKSRVYCMCHVLNLAAQQIAKPFRKEVTTDGDEPSANNDFDMDEDMVDDSENPVETEDVDEHDHQEWQEMGNGFQSWALDGEEDDEEDLASDFGKEVEMYNIPPIVPGSEDDRLAKRAGKILRKLAYFAKRLRYSRYAKKRFAAACIKLEVKPTHNVRQDVRTRWNSTGNMTQDGERTFPAILEIQDDPRVNIPHAYRFDEDDLEHIENLNRLFAAFQVVTDVMSRAEVSMLADVIIHLDSLDYMFGKMCEDDALPLYARHASNRAREKLNEYYSKTDTSDAYRFAILCHPSMRAKYLRMSKWEPEWIEDAINALSNVYRDHYKRIAQPVQPATTPEISPFGYSSFAMHLFGQESGGKPICRCPVREFVNAPIVDPLPDANGNPILCNPLAWWHSQRVAGNEWSGFMQLALDVLSMPATSVDVERLFSFVGSTISKRRHQLSSYTIQASATLGAYDKAGLVKPGCLVTPKMKKLGARKGKA